LAEQPNHRQQSDERAREIVQELSKWVNDFGHHNSAFAATLMDQHRTLQQQVFKVMLACIEAWAQTDQYDLRNEFTVKKSREIMELLPGGASVPLI